MKTLFHPEIFKTNDIRGVYKKDFGPGFVTLLGGAFLQFAAHRLRLRRPFSLSQRGKPEASPGFCVAIGFDARTSSPEIAQTLTQSITFLGAEVRFLGLVTTPLCFSSPLFDPHIQACIMVTASHNPPEYNGFKLLVKNQNICQKDLLKIKNILIKQSVKKNLLSRRGGRIKKQPAFFLKAYTQFLSKEFFDLQKNLYKNRRSFKMVIDCSNGSSGRVAQRVFKALNIKALWLFTRPDGTFPHHLPDPSHPKHLQHLKAKVLRHKADMGAAFDGDGDRVVVMNQKGDILHGDSLIKIFLSSLLKPKKQVLKTARPSVVVDVKCSDWFFEFLKTRHCRVHISSSGHSLVRQKTLTTGSLFGGELSGHYFFCDKNFPFDDGLYSLLRLLQILSSSSSSSSSSRKLKNPSSYKESPEIRVPIVCIKKAKKHLQVLKSYYKKNKSARCLFQDGVRVSLPGAWGLARFSGTGKEWTFRFGGSRLKEQEKLRGSFKKTLHLPPGSF